MKTSPVDPSSSQARPAASLAIKAQGTENASKSVERPGKAAQFSPLRYELSKVPPGDPQVQTPLLSAVLLQEAARVHASDIHLDPVDSGYEVRLRTDGILGEPARLERSQGLHLVRSFKSQAGLDPGHGAKPLSGRTEVSIGGRIFSVRVATAPCVGGEKLTMRLLPPHFVGLSLSELGLTDAAHDLLRNYIQDARGMMLVSGPTGSGKTTTLYAMARKLSESHRSIVSIEDPVEYVLDGIRQIQVNEKQGLTFAEGVRGILRLDPDIIMMGEMRDRPSAEAALDAAESGHACLSTLHARDAAGTITVLRSFGFTDHEIAATVDLVVAQRLVRRLCPHCRRQGAPTTEELRVLEFAGKDVPKETWQSMGCDQCNGTGYAGRVGIFEMHRMDEHDADLILKHVDEHTFRQHLLKTSDSMLADAILKALGGITTLTEVQTVGGIRFYSSAGSLHGAP